MKVSLSIGFLGVVFASCLTLRQRAEVQKVGEQTYSLKFVTGSKDSSLYADVFEKTAQETCIGEYEIVEQGFKPSTPTPDTDSYDWTIKCQK